MQSSFTGFSPKIFRPTDLDRKLFWRFDPWRWKLKEGRKKKQVSSIFSNNEYRGGIFLHIQQFTNFSKIWYSNLR